MNAYKLLIVDDDKLVAWSLSRDLEGDDCNVKVAPDGESALTMFKEMEPDVVLLDLKLPGIDGLQVLRLIRKVSKDPIIIMMTAYATVQTAVEAIQLGATDFIKKPFSHDELMMILERALQREELTREIASMRSELKQKYGIKKIVGDSPAMQKVFELIRRIAASDATTVLISGESGTGKDLAAKAIHYESRRFKHAFMAMNCGSLPDTLLESELFGHEKGAFTDAKALKKGLFELADKGTVLLDEIGDASPSLQVKLLRFIEEKTFKRIGGSKDIEVDVRIIAATNRSLKKMMKAGHFREDLYYRLQVIPVELPTLRERREDIPPLCLHFIDRFNREFGKCVRGVSEEAMKVLERYSWPGNIRELKNVLERVMILESEQEIHLHHLPLELNLSQEVTSVTQDISLPSGGASLSGVEKALLEQALEHTGGNQSQAAQLLRISRHALRYKMKKYNLMA